jgi:hypothetical protein
MVYIHSLFNEKGSSSCLVNECDIFVVFYWLFVTIVVPGASINLHSLSNVKGNSCRLCVLQVSVWCCNCFSLATINQSHSMGHRAST